MICLDTNVVIGLVNGTSRALRERFAVEADEVAIAAVVHFELLYGLAKRRMKKATGDRLREFLRAPIAILPFGKDDAAEAADIRAHLEGLGTPIGPYDVLIAAQARRRGAVLVTANTREFARVAGLALQDWTAA